MNNGLLLSVLWPLLAYYLFQPVPYALIFFSDTELDVVTAGTGSNPMPPSTE